jgi:hypothetical protein
VQPPLGEHLDGARLEPVADLLQPGRVIAGREPVRQLGAADAGLDRLPLGPLVPVHPDLRRVGEIGADLDERSGAPLRSTPATARPPSLVRAGAWPQRLPWMTAAVVGALGARFAGTFAFEVPRAGRFVLIATGPPLTPGHNVEIPQQSRIDRKLKFGVVAASRSACVHCLGEAGTVTGAS